MSEEQHILKRLANTNQRMIIEFKENLKVRSSKKSSGGLIGGVRRVMGGAITTKNFRDGSKYYGELSVAGDREGQGIIEFGNGDVYFGSWKKDLFDGKGTYIFKSQERYQGNLVEGSRQGEGEFFYSNGNKYSGSWRNNEKNGRGFLYFANGNVYEGNWKDGLYSGPGKETFFYGDLFEGDYKYGKKAGNGVFKFECGSDYNGEWKNGRAHGMGK